jgi:hypothetical protein
MRAGRKRKVTEKVIQKILNGLQYGKTEMLSCMRAGISYESFRLWRHKDPKNEERVQEALEEWCNALLVKLDQHGEEDPRVLQWRLERMFPARFGRPELQIHLAQINAAAAEQPNTSIWFQPPTSPGDDIQFDPQPWEQPAQLPAPAPSVPQRLTEPDFSSLPPAVRAVERQKYFAQHPSKVQEVPFEVVEPGMAELAAKVNRHERAVGAVGQDVRGMTKPTTVHTGARGLTVAARPTPPQEGHEGWDGSIPML